MTEVEFVRAVQRMREEQTRFFSCNRMTQAEEKREAMVQARIWEKAVDREVARRLALLRERVLDL